MSRARTRADGTVVEGDIAADAVNFATHLKAGTDGELITWGADANPAPVLVGTSGHVLTSGGADAVPVFAAALGGLYASVAILYDLKPYNTAGGTFASGAWRTRELTEVEDADGIVTVVSDQFTLAAGTYTIEWSAPAMDVNLNMTAFVDVSASPEALRGFGTAQHAQVGSTVTTNSAGTAVVTITGDTTYEIQHRCQTTKNLIGKGEAQYLDSGVGSYFTYAIIYKHN